MVDDEVSIWTESGCVSGEGDGTPLQYSCLENPMDGGAWWAAVHGVAQSRTRLKQLSSSSSSRLCLWNRDHHEACVLGSPMLSPFFVNPPNKPPPPEGN